MFAGVKKGIIIGKDVIRVGKSISNEVKDVPVIGSYANQILNHPYTAETEKTLNTAGNVTGIIDEAMKPPPVPKSTYTHRRWSIGVD